MSTTAYITTVVALASFMLAAILAVVGVLGARIGDLRNDVGELRHITTRLVEDVVLLRGTK